MISFLLKFITSKVAERLIALAVNKVLKSSKSGISKELATTMINGVAKSKLNPTTDDLFKDVYKVLS